MSVHNKLYVKTELFTNRVDGTDFTTADWAFLGTVDQNMATTDNVQFNNLTLTGDLTVSGTTTLVNTTNTEIKDNIVLLNNAEAGAGVGGGSGTSGLEIDRGSLTNQQLLFNETTDTWTSGTGTTLGTDKFTIAEFADATQTQGAIPGLDANGRFDEAEGLTVAEVNQLQNIDATTISQTQWGYVGAMNQGVATTDNVTFNDVTVNGDLSLTNPIADTVSAVLTADPAPVTDGVSIFDTSGGAFAATLPDNATKAGFCYTVYLKTAGNNLTITAAGADTIEGNATLVLDIAGQHAKLCSIGDGTWILR